MSNTEPDPTAELEDFLADELLKPKVEAEAPPESQPEVVRDEPPQRDTVTVPEPAAPEQPPAPEEAEPEEEEEEVEEEDAFVAWATKKYGDEPNKWAKAARDMETHITRLTNEKHASDELAAQWYEVAQQQEQAAQQTGMGLPLSAQEEMFIENSLSDPLESARQAAFNGRVPLYNGILERVAAENPSLAAQIGAQVQIELSQWAQQQQQADMQPPPSLQDQLGGSFSRLGIDLRKDGPRMSEKISELGEYHPYVRAILTGADAERDLAVQAVHDLTRATTFNSRQVERGKAVKREEQLRQEAMVVQAGGIQPPPPPRQESLLEQGMTEEWKRAGAWPYDDE